MQSSVYQETLAPRFSKLLLALEEIAHTYYLSGHLEQALLVYQTGMALLDLPEVELRDRARFLLRHGNMLAVKTLFENAPIDEALSLLERAQQLATQCEAAQVIADALDGIGFAHYLVASNKREGDPHELLPYFQDALERRRALHDERGVSESLFHLGLVTQVLGQKEEAHACYTEALQIAQQHDYSSEASDALRHLGFLSQEQGNLAQAQHFLAESLRLREHIGKHIYLPFAYVALADVHLEQGNIELAASLCQRALHLSQELNIKKAQFYALYTSGSICQQRQEHAQARSYFEQAYNVARAINLQHAMQKISLILRQPTS